MVKCFPEVNQSAKTPEEPLETPEVKKSAKKWLTSGKLAMIWSLYLIIHVYNVHPICWHSLKGRDGCRIWG